MKCLRKYKWVKLLRSHLPAGKGLLGYWAKLASRAAFRKGNSVYCGHINPVTPGMWSGGVVGLKSILGVKKRAHALWIMSQLLNDIRKAGKKISVRGSDSERLNCMIAWRSRIVVTAYEKEMEDEAKTGVALSIPLIRAYFSHGRNCKNCRNCIYDCQGMSKGFRRNFEQGHDKLRMVNVETVRYKQTPARFAEPQKRGDIDRKPPRRKH